MGRPLAIALLGVLVACPLSAAEVLPLARGAVLSAPDCASAADIIAEGAPSPRNRTFIRVQHMGDDGTVELEREVANPVTWDVGALTGLPGTADTQRGYRDEAAPAPASAFQLACGSAGFFINTARFSHRLPIIGGGSSATIARDLDPVVPFGQGLVLNVRARLPTMATPGTPVVDGTAQLSFLYYLWDRTSGLQVAHVIDLYDNRPMGVGGSGAEFAGFDNDVAFVGSPLAEATSSGAPVRFVSPPGLGTMRYGKPFPETVAFRAVVTASNLRAALEAARAIDARLSPDPASYDVIMFGVLAEVFPGTGTDHEITFGGSIEALSLESFASPFARRR